MTSRSVAALTKALRPGPRRLVGEVVSDKMQKSVVVRVEHRRKHKLYDVQVAKHKKLMAHDEAEMTSIGDQVEIQFCRPVSKRKNWFVTRVVRPKDGGLGFDVEPLPVLKRLRDKQPEPAGSS